MGGEVMLGLAGTTLFLLDGVDLVPVDGVGGLRGGVDSGLGDVGSVLEDQRVSTTIAFNLKLWT
jgi:hypothetical protein